MSNKASIAEQINDQLREISSFSVEQNVNLENEAIKGTITSNKLNIDAATQVAKNLKDLPWEQIPIALQNDALHHVSNIRNKIKVLADFKFPPNMTPQDHVSRISNDLFQQRPETQNKPPLLFHSQQLASNASLLLLSDKTRSEVASEAAKLKEKVVEVETSLQQQVLEMSSLLEKGRETAGKIGAERHSKEFGELAASHRILGLIWLGVTSLFFIGAWLSAWHLFAVFALLDPNAVQPNFSFSQLAPRVLVLSLIYSAAVWSSKIYKSHRHLNVLNKHRETALQTFRTFVGAAENDPQVKNAILLECTRTIFAHSPSGYLDAETPPVSSSLVDVVKAVTKVDSTK